MTLYDTIGRHYAQTRKCDPRIATALLGILKSASTIADIGAGTGSYALFLAKQGYRVLAVEPSATMRGQAVPHSRIEWFDGFAENLPLPDGAVEAAIVMLAFHHFRDHQQALREIDRVTGNGQIVLFTADPVVAAQFWLVDYFPAWIEDLNATFLPIAELTSAIATTMKATVNVAPFLLPHDLTDSFAAVGWARPELYLDNTIRSGISSFAKFDPDELETGLSQLRRDLDSGAWDQKYGDLRQQQQYDAGYRFVFTSG